MALKVELKPGEKFILGDSVVTNDDQRTRLFIEGSAPILREKDIMTPAEANSPARRIYLSVQLLYLSRDLKGIQDDYFTFVRDIISAAPSTLPFVTRISTLILNNQLYAALKEAKKLVEYERELVAHATAGG
ncbi:MAG: flagellar biosynthesis repressor FlbT [Bauldia sp.]